MSPNPTFFLGLVLCLGQTIHTQEGALPRPSIRAEPGPVLPRGQPVTIVCRGPAWADVIRLEFRRSAFRDQKISSQRGSPWTEARFLTPAVSEDTVGHYCCYYRKGSSWSEPSKSLELKVTDEDVSNPPSGPASQNYTLGNYVRISLACVVLLILVAIVAEAVYSWHRWTQRPQE
ncbi:leukocyte-associated immunoglobulin-like receptor 2 [Desmodus rotundus]|nr:leukocyte-associated immunoglobulin-like receptor 2 [Desmodus rotundus]